MIKEIKVKSALHKLKRKIPYGWDLNIYRGCGHGCCYCYASYSHLYLDKANDENFCSDIYVKTNIVDQLEKELQAASWKRDVINIGGVTDSYQPVEADYRLMPEILKLLIKYKTPAIISTKSNLILRDYDLIEQLSHLTYINVAASITTGDEKIRQLIEPGATTTEGRLAVLREFKKTKASIGFHLMPILPHITDGMDNIKELLISALECGVDYVLPGVLYLRGTSRTVFFTFLKREFPDLVEPYRLLYQKGGADKAYKNDLYRQINLFRDKFNVPKSYMKPMRDRLKPQEPAPRFIEG